MCLIRYVPACIFVLSPIVGVNRKGHDPARNELQRLRGGPQAARALRALDAEVPADGGRGLAHVAVEFGAGTGVYTEGILRRLQPEARLISYEVDGALAASVARRLPDRRLEVVNASAEKVGVHLEALGRGADVVVSSLPFSTLPEPVRHDLLDAARDALAPGGHFLVLQYSKTVLPELECRFPKIRHRFSPLNVPPAFLFACELP
jgi:phospholipid N-methyltransferase